jgi:very-short-patch-repair endonuclease
VVSIRDRVHNKTHLGERRTKLRKNLTPAEATLWKALKNSNLSGRKFRRQHSVGNYILDFYCDSEKLAVELDGEVHRTDAAAEYDHKRKLFLNGLGIKVVRFENFLVFEDILYVMHRIESFFGWQEKNGSENSPP